ncbi:40S ribosomal S26 [Tubulinosema ratisbonensis]|uniref:40S ribosomal protein S26 n=1 Tax=Tubulinosema ratisbonensis TaxID=291195 RepID=A0A437AKR1_9MICR|nr:40S ribosomal S26 [Tubulinosema ratisbonensis]RVD91727.1 40S ribosomal S26 [Tubulinosema ratisbonensis]
MPSKRRNNGKARNNRGHVQFIRCDNCSAAVPKDKAIKRFQIKALIESAAHDDVRNATVYQEFVMPKSFHKTQYCVSCAVHTKTVRCRSKEERKKRYGGSETKVF